MAELPSFRERCQNTQDHFCLCLRKCCNYDALYLFPKSYLRFRHIRRMFSADYPDAYLHGIYFDAECTVEVPELWDDQLVCKSMAAANIRACSKPDDILAYRFFLKIEYGGTDDEDPLKTKTSSFKCKTCAARDDTPPSA